MTPLHEARVDLAPLTDSPTVLVLDADRTLAKDDTGRSVGRAFGLNQRIRSVFEAEGYSPLAFGEHAGIWSEVCARRLVDECERVAQGVQIYDIWRRLIGEHPELSVVVVTAGLPQVWRRVLSLHGLSRVPVLGGLHSELDAYFVTAQCKAWVVAEARRRGRRVLAAGDSEVDLPMLQAADVALWVPDTKGSPRLRARLHEVPGVRQVTVDPRRFPPLPTVDGAALDALIA